MIVDQIYFRAQVVPYEERAYYIDQLQNPAFKGCLSHAYTEVLYMNNVNSINVFMCKEVFMTIPIVIYIPKNFYLTEALNEKIDNLKAAGLIDYWNTMSFEKGKMTQRESTQPKVIKVQHLTGCFQVWICGLLLSSFVFWIENIMIKFCKQSNFYQKNLGNLFWWALKLRESFALVFALKFLLAIAKLSFQEDIFIHFLALFWVFLWWKKQL